MARILEIVNLFIKWQEENIEIDLLDTGFVSLIKTLGEQQGKRLSEIVSGGIIGVDLIQNISDRQAYIDLKVGEYQGEILAFLATPAGLELIAEATKHDMNLPFDSDYSLLTGFNTNTLLDYTFLEKTVKNEISLRKRAIDIERRLKILSTLQLIKDFSSQARFTVMHPGLNIVCLITGGIDTVSTVGGGQYQHSITAMNASFYSLDANYGVLNSLGGLLISASESYSNSNPTPATKPNPDLRFTSLGDAIVLNNKVYDFKEYSLSLVLKDEYNITLETIISRV